MDDDKKIRFTKAAIGGLKLPAPGKRIYYYDTEVNHLAIGVTDKGAKSFYVYRRVNGQPEKIFIGRYPDLSIEQARKLAEEINGAVAVGGNPNERRRAARKELSFRELLDGFVADKKAHGKVSWKDDEGLYRRYLTDWEGVKLSKITRPDVKRLHLKIGEDNGRFGANRMLALVRGAYNFAIREGHYSKPNPAGGVKPFDEPSRQRRLHSDEMPAFFQAVADEDSEDVRDYVLLSLWTGARRGNVLAMRWSDINLTRRTWTIPGTKTKNREELTVPLTPVALAILKRREAVSSGPWVFPGFGGTGHMVEPKKGWARILKRAKLEDLRLHDLRRTMGSWQVDTGASLAIVGKTLGHKSQATTAVYARLSLDPVRQSLLLATTAIEKAAGIELPKAEDGAGVDDGES